MENDSLVNVPSPAAISRPYTVSSLSWTPQVNMLPPPTFRTAANGSAKDADRLAEWTPARLRRAIEESSPLS